jgi:hypothetical protein
MKRIVFVYSLFVLLVFGGCKKENMCDCIKSTGSDIRSDRDATPFTIIQLEGKIDLVLTQDTIERIYVVAGKHLIDNIETSVSSGTLFIRNHNTCNFVRSYSRRMTVYASVRYLRNLIYLGAGDVTCSNTLMALSGSDTIIGVDSREGSGNILLNVNAKLVNATIETGPADIRIIGSANQIIAWETGNGVIHTDDIPCSNVHAHDDGTADMYIASSAAPGSALSADIFNIGNIYCKGTPAQVKKNRTGNGNLIIQ